MSDDSLKMYLKSFRLPTMASLLDEDRPVGADRVMWQGRDDRGRTLPSGAYYVRLETVGMIDTRKVMLLK